MKKITLMAALVIMTASAFAQQLWKIDGAHSKVRFTTKYLLISDVDGEFKKFDGKVTSSAADFSDLSATITVDVNSIVTDNDMRDGHLKSDDFFNAEKYPSMTFKSTGIKSLGNKKYMLSGLLTIRDVTKAVSIPLVYGGTVTDPWGNIKAGFKATGSINRQEYGLKWDNKAATGEAVVSDDVDFTIDLILIKDVPKK
ncbi:MAG TPA: YceI family protein [Bacteroidia bacterium]|nr:YceI family protein [Bacteroidia bacterium]